MPQLRAAGGDKEESDKKQQKKPKRCKNASKGGIKRPLKKQ
jgi:hypothetical protein